MAPTPCDLLGALDVEPASSRVRSGQRWPHSAAVQVDDLPTPDQLMLLCISNRVLSELAGVPLAPTNVAPADAIPHAITIFQRMLRAYTHMFRLTTSLKDEVRRLRDAVSLVSMVTQRLAPGGAYSQQVSTCLAMVQPVY